MPAQPNADSNLLFAVLALQVDLIDPAQFAEACTAWTARKHLPLAELLVERGWLTEEDRADVERLLRRKLAKHNDARASLAAVARPGVRGLLEGVEDADVRQSLTGLPSQPSLSAVLTVDHVPDGTERYALADLHATGGIGRVWRARDRQLGRDVALKELRPERAGDPQTRARFLQEAQVTGQLEHPGVVPVYELARRADGQAFYTMRFVRGRTLSEAARAYHASRRDGRAEAFELPALLAAFATVCHTVAYAHSRGVLHRDLKGQNVLLGDFGEVVVLDWGLAKLLSRTEGAQAPQAVALDRDATGSDHTLPGQALGTPAYMAPEQAAGRLDLIDARTDVYGLGAILYEVLTGEPPFTGASVAEVLRRAREEGARPPREHWPEVPSGLEAVCLRALAREPAERWQSAAELGKEVQGWQESQRRQAEEALRASEAFYRAVIDSIQHCVWTAGPDGGLDYINEWGLRYFGMRAEQVLGEGWRNVIHPDDLPATLKRWALALQSGEGYEVEFRLRRRDGVYRWFLGRAVPVRDAGGDITRWFGTCTEIDDQKVTEQGAIQAGM